MSKVDRGVSKEAEGKVAAGSDELRDVGQDALEHASEASETSEAPTIDGASASDEASEATEALAPIEALDPDPESA